MRSSHARGRHHVLGGTLAVVALAVLAAVALANPVTGKWSGKLAAKGPHGTVTFRVIKHGKAFASFRMKGVYGTLHCGGTVFSGPTIGNATIAISSGKIKGNSVSVKRVKDSAGVHETDTLKMHFSGRTARGTVDQEFNPPNCGTGVLHFKAHAH